MSVGSQEGQTKTGSRTVAKVLALIRPLLALLAAGMLIISGGLDWPMAWAYIGVVAVGSVVQVLVTDSGLLAERMSFKAGVKRWDIAFAIFVGRIGPIAILITAWMDKQAGWSPQIPLPAQIAALVIVALSFSFIIWAMVVNRFFSAMVRIQRDRGHTVVAIGPYAVVRHPGYVGIIVYILATSPALGSVWALVPAGITAIVCIIRTALEDRMLQNELEGYKEYAGRVRYRLLPGVW